MFARPYCKLQPFEYRTAECIGHAYKQQVELVRWCATNLLPPLPSDLQEGGAALQIGRAAAAAIWPAANSGDCGRRKKGEDEKTSVRK